MLGAGVVVVLAGIAYANIRFKRVEGVTVNTESIQKRNLEAIVSASGKIQPKRFVNISADTMGRVTGPGGQRRRPRQERPVPAAGRPAEPSERRPAHRGVARAAKSQTEQLTLSIDSAKTSLKQAEDNSTASSSSGRAA